MRYTHKSVFSHPSSFKAILAIAFPSIICLSIAFGGGQSQKGQSIIGSPDELTESIIIHGRIAKEGISNEGTFAANCPIYKRRDAEAFRLLKIFPISHISVVDKNKNSKIINKLDINQYIGTHKFQALVSRRSFKHNDKNSEYQHVYWIVLYELTDNFIYVDKDGYAL